MKIMIFLAVCIALINPGCATIDSTKASHEGIIMYTNAPKEIAFDAVYKALLNAGYQIKESSYTKFYIKCHYFTPGTTIYTIYAQINIYENTGGTEIIYKATQPGAFTTIDLAGVYKNCVNNTLNEISKTLVGEGYEFKKI